jgi:hypothetical protein
VRSSGWMRYFKVPLWLALVYIAVLGVVASFPTRSTAGRVSAGPTATPAAASQYAVCGIDHTSDPKTGRCVPVSVTPLPCVQGSKFDSKAGFCMPTAPKAAVAPPPPPVQQPQVPEDPFANLPGIRSDNNAADPWWNNP